jgi:hypothetical protein
MKPKAINNTSFTNTQKAELLDRLMTHFFQDSDGVKLGIWEDTPLGEVDIDLELGLLKLYSDDETT